MVSGIGAKEQMPTPQMKKQFILMTYLQTKLKSG